MHVTAGARLIDATSSLNFRLKSFLVLCLNIYMLLTRFSSPEIEQIEYQNGLYQHGTPKASMCIMYESIHAVPTPPPAGNPYTAAWGRSMDCFANVCKKMCHSNFGDLLKTVRSSKKV